MEKERLEKGEGLPEYIKDHLVYYAGPAKKPDNYASGSFGPTTAGRMDTYVPIFQKQVSERIIKLGRKFSIVGQRKSF